jgi:hypothetical protein
VAAAAAPTQNLAEMRAQTLAISDEEAPVVAAASPAPQMNTPQPLTLNVATTASSSPTTTPTTAPTPAPSPAPAVLAAISVSPEDAHPEPAPVVTPYDGLADIEELARLLAAAKADKLAFIAKWNAIGAKCDARKQGFLGVLGASCQRIRTAQRRGDIFSFAYECFQLDAIHQQQTNDYRAAATATAAVADALRANAHVLEELCSKETYARAWPAFAAMVDDAEALKYFPPRRSMAAMSTGALVATMDAELWRNGMMNTASSMFPSGVNMNVQGPLEPAWSPVPAGSADVGGLSGGTGTAPASAAPQ